MPRLRRLRKSRFFQFEFLSFVLASNLVIPELSTEFFKPIYFKCCPKRVHGHR